MKKISKLIVLFLFTLMFVSCVSIVADKSFPKEIVIPAQPKLSVGILPYLSNVYIYRQTTGGSTDKGVTYVARYVDLSPVAIGLGNGIYFDAKFNIFINPIELSEYGNSGSYKVISGDNYYIKKKTKYAISIPGFFGRITNYVIDDTGYYSNAAIKNYFVLIDQNHFQIVSNKKIEKNVFNFGEKIVICPQANNIDYHASVLENTANGIEGYIWDWNGRDKISVTRNENAIYLKIGGKFLFDPVEIKFEFGKNEIKSTLNNLYGTKIIISKNRIKSLSEKNPKDIFSVIMVETDKKEMIIEPQ